MQSVLSRIWTRVAVSISYDDNNYTTGTSNKFLNYNCIAVSFDSNGIIYKIDDFNGIIYKIDDFNGIIYKIDDFNVPDH